MSDQEVWCPDAEPWEALAEALFGRTGCPDRGEYDNADEWEYAAASWLSRTIIKMGWRLAPASVPVPEEPEGEEGRTLRRLTAVEGAIWGHYRGKHPDVGLLNKVNYLTRRVDALESAAPVESEEKA